MTNQLTLATFHYQATTNVSEDHTVSHFFFLNKGRMSRRYKTSNLLEVFKLFRALFSFGILDNYAYISLI